MCLDHLLIALVVAGCCWTRGLYVLWQDILCKIGCGALFLFDISKSGLLTHSLRVISRVAPSAVYVNGKSPSFALTALRLFTRLNSGVLGNAFNGSFVIQSRMDYEQSFSVSASHEVQLTVDLHRTVSLPPHHFESAELVLKLIAVNICSAFF